MQKALIEIRLIDLRCKRIIFSYRNESYVGGHSDERVSKSLVRLGHLICLPSCITNSGEGGMESVSDSLSLSLSLSPSPSLPSSLSLTYFTWYSSRNFFSDSNQGSTSFWFLRTIDSSMLLEKPLNREPSFSRVFLVRTLNWKNTTAEP